MVSASSGRTHIMHLLFALSRKGKITSRPSCSLYGLASHDGRVSTNCLCRCVWGMGL